eukprot:CAMPEP_0115830020 /NCGR_PEP_ID=MMETSP0287-20121206/1401_1 /TAXON_ID=412157 /ORGANISM="Chrysochromulina rotalis, Strain UIO044" /LENGTH=66 /DNA_ID=CAMNT_0003283309 /DNA_START=562 /DNA_END=762 /DNA_ORIENTATION=+
MKRTITARTFLPSTTSPIQSTSTTPTESLPNSQPRLPNPNGPPEHVDDSLWLVAVAHHTKKVPMHR